MSAMPVPILVSVFLSGYLIVRTAVNFVVVGQVSGDSNQRVFDGQLI